VNFAARASALPRLGIGVSTEYGAGGAPGALDVARLRETHPQFASFLEIGVETSKGLDAQAKEWAGRKLPTTYHYLDVNLDEPEDFDRAWLDEVRAIAAVTRPAWACGDAGLWHLGRRERGHMLLLPPVLTDESARAMADGIARLRDETGLEVLPENPPGQVFLGDLHLLDFFARVCERADTGMLLDCAHLAIYQRTRGTKVDALDGLDGFPLERVIEMHVAGSTTGDVDGYPFAEDDHVPAVLPETWRIFEKVAARAPNLKAVVFECERNDAAACLPGFERIARTFAGSAGTAT
jgi:uncharacterized protein (UPF0276 family)